MKIFGIEVRGKVGRLPAYRPIPSNSRTIRQWQEWEMKRGCSTCDRKGCHRMNHSYSLCGRCDSPYCNGDACPGRRRR